MPERFVIKLPWPQRVLSPNGRGHHMARARAAKSYRSAAHWECKTAGVPVMEWARLKVTFYPRPRGPLPDRDNAIASFKAGQDGIADCLGIDDRHLEVTHKISPERHECVVVEIEGERA